MIKKVMRWALGVRRLLLLFMLLLSLLPTPYASSSLSDGLRAEGPLLTIYADESSPSSAIQAKLKILETEIASKAAFFKQEVRDKLQNKAYTGIVLSKTDTTLTIQTDNGTRTVNIKDFTEFTGKPSGSVKASSKLTLATLQPEDFVAALGDLDENQILTTKRLVKLIAPAKSERQVLVGTIISSTKDNFSLQTSQNQALKITTTKNTDYFPSPKIASGSGILVVTQTGKDNSLIARVIYLLKGPAKGV